MAVVHQVMRQREPGRARARPPAPCSRWPASAAAGAESSGFQRVSRRRSRSPRAAPARPSACGSRSAGCRPAPASDRCRPSCSRCRCGGRSRRRSGCRPRRWRARRALLPRAFTRFISEIFSSSGQPARVTPKTLFWKPPSFSFSPLRAAVLALVVAPDAVIGLVERAGEIGAGIGQREAVARAANRPRAGAAS